MRIDGDIGKAPPAGWERSYLGLKEELKNVFRSERAIWGSLRGGWYVLYMLHLPVILVLFFPLALMTALLWPLGKYRREVSVGIVFGLMVPLFQLLLSVVVCTTEEVKLGICVMKEEQAVPGVEVVVHGFHKKVTDEHGMVFIKPSLVISRIENLGIAQEYCRECFENVPFTIFIEHDTTKQRIEEEFNYGYANYRLGDGGHGNLLTEKIKADISSSLASHEQEEREEEDDWFMLAVIHLAPDSDTPPK